mmetsp:Transcript_71479/g.201839  ORF Transcript_71479/g.201839 Transcript_71479/m.201839 type:complete len:87 (+) Transcript_71479:390-650(+)
MLPLEVEMPFMAPSAATRGSHPKELDSERSAESSEQPSLLRSIGNCRSIRYSPGPTSSDADLLRATPSAFGNLYFGARVLLEKLSS